MPSDSSAPRRPWPAIESLPRKSPAGRKDLHTPARPAGQAGAGSPSGRRTAPPGRKPIRVRSVNDDAQVKPAHFDGLLGTEWLDDDPDDARVRLAVRDELRQPFGLDARRRDLDPDRERLLAGDGRRRLGRRDGGDGAVDQVSFLRPVTEGTSKSAPRPATAAAPPGSGRPRSSTTRASSAPSRR